MKNPLIDLQKYDQLMFTKVQWLFNIKKIVFSTNGKEQLDFHEDTSPK